MDKMTNEEAIAIIRKEYLCVDRDCDIERSCGKCDLVMPSKEPILQAYKLAMKALEQEPKLRQALEMEKGAYNALVKDLQCSDCISRQAVLEAIEDDNRNAHYSCFASNNDAECFKQIIRELPPVTPAEKQEPRENVSDINDGNIYECPCGYGWDKNKVVRYHFCPNCGRAVNSTEQEPCDAVSRKEVMNMLHNHAFDYATSTKILALLKTMCGEVDRMPSVIPQYTDAEIQKMQELEQAEIQKAYEIGKAEGSEVLDKIRAEIVHLHDWAFSREEILRIIDKYKKESEE